MAANLIWLKADPDGETRAECYPVSIGGPQVTSNDGSFALFMQDIPATNVRLVELPKQGSREVFHPAPRRQLVIVLQGNLDVSATDGSHFQLGPGDWLFADDVAGRGHRVEDVGEDNFVTIQIAVPDDWEWPDSLPS